MEILQVKLNPKETLIVGKEAKVHGQILVSAQLILSGFLEGDIQAAKKVVIHKTGNLQGSMNAPCLVIEEGAVLERAGVYESGRRPA